MILCPLCDVEWREEPVRCLCGYDFETRDPTRAIELLRAQLGRTGRLTTAGVALIVSAPLAILAIPGLLGLLVSPLLFGFGIVCTAVGILRGHRDRKTLANARARLQLPAARVIPR